MRYACLTCRKERIWRHIKPPKARVLTQRSAVRGQGHLVVLRDIRDLDSGVGSQQWYCIAGDALWLGIQRAMWHSILVAKLSDTHEILD